MNVESLAKVMCDENSMVTIAKPQKIANTIDIGILFVIDKLAIYPLVAANRPVTRI